MIKYYVMPNFVFLTSVCLIIANNTAAKCLILLQCHIKHSLCIKFYARSHLNFFALINPSLAIEADFWSRFSHQFHSSIHCLPVTRKLGKDNNRVHISIWFSFGCLYNFFQ